MCQSLFFNKAASLIPATLLKKRLWHRYVPVNFAKFLRALFFYKTPPMAASNYDMVSISYLKHKLYHHDQPARFHNTFH